MNWDTHWSAFLHSILEMTTWLRRCCGGIVACATPPHCSSQRPSSHMPHKTQTLAGLMLNVFGVYKGCELMLESLAVPERAVDECLRAARAPPPEPDPLESLAPFLQAWSYQGLESAAPDALEPGLVEM